MNVSKILKNSKFKPNEIQIINTFISSIMHYNHIYYSEANNFQSLHIISKKIYIFNKIINKDKDMGFYIIDNNFETTFRLFNNEFYPITTYIIKDGESTGVGNGTKEKIKKMIFQMLYLDEDYKMFIIFPDNKKNIEEAIICIENINLFSPLNVENVEAKELIRKIKYFGVNLKTLDVYCPSNIKEFKLEIFQNVEKEYSKNFSSMFLSYISINKIHNNPITEELLSQYQSFMAMYRMIEI